MSGGLKTHIRSTMTEELSDPDKLRKFTSHETVHRIVDTEVIQGSYTNSPQKFHDFSRTFSQFCRTKNQKSAADFHRNDMFITTLRSVASGKINLGVCIDKFNHVLSG